MGPRTVGYPILLAEDHLMELQQRGFYMQSVSWLAQLLFAGWSLVREMQQGPVGTLQSN